MIRKHSAGFTLIELMITVAIVGILASIAYPSYRSYILKSKRAEARTALFELLQQQERYMTQRNTYLAFTAGDTAVTAFKTFAGDSVNRTPYLLGAEVCDTTTTIADCVRVFAVPQMPDPEVATIKVSSTGVKECTGTRTDLCWK